MTFPFRRRTLLGAGIWAAATGVAVSLPRWVRNCPWRSFTPEEARTVDAICAQLIPADQDPGAREADVVNYIDLQLARSFRRYRPVYRAGLAGIDSASRARFGRAFAELPFDSQVEIMEAAEKNSKPFFDLILAHCRQGFYGDPRHGGNRNMVSWKMLKLPFPMVRGRMHYEPPSKG